MRQVWGTLLVLLSIIAARGILAWGSEVTANRAGGRARTELRERLVTHLFALGPAYIRGERSGELVSVLCEGVEALDPYVSQYLPQVVLAALVPAILLAAIFWIDVPSGVILLIVTPILPFIMAVVGMMARAETKRQWRSLGLMSAHFLDVLQGLTTLKIFGGSRRQVEAIRHTSDRFRRTTMRMLRVAFFSSLVLELGATISTAVIAVEIGLRLLDGLMPFQQALFVLLLAPEYFLPLRLLGARYHAGMTGKVAGQRIADILNTPVAVSQPPARPSPSHFIAGGTIHFERVGYTHDGQRPALHDVSFDIQPGKKVALVGPSGAGKSTVAHLLLRFIEAERGAVLVDGTPLEKIPVHQLSAGEAQRISLGRAFLKNAPLLILDEATSYLDAENQTGVLEAISRLKRGRADAHPREIEGVYERRLVEPSRLRYRNAPGFLRAFNCSGTRSSHHRPHHVVRAGRVQ